MSLRVSCPECNTDFSIDDDMTGGKVRCPECQHGFVAPEDEPAGVIEEDEAIYDAKGRSAPVRKRMSREEEDDEPAAPPAKRKGKGGIIAAVVIGVASLGLLFVVCGGLAVTLYFTLGGNDQQAKGPVVPMPGPGGPGMPFPPDGPPDNGNPQNPGNINLDPDPPPVMEAPPAAKPDPKADPKADPAPKLIKGETRDKVKESTVYIHVHMGNGGEGSGSGFFAVEPGIVITNAHVLGMMRAQSRPPTDVEVVVHAGQPNEQTLKGTILGVDRFTDLAVLRVVGAKLPPPLPVQSAASLEPLQHVYFFGFPFGKKLGAEISIGAGTVSSVRKDPNGSGMLSQVQFTGDMQPGNSGGPVADAAGRIVGIAVAIIPNTRINFAVAGDMIKPIIDGRVDEAPRFGERYLDGKQVKMPVKLHLINPLGRVNAVRIDMWAGNPGADRPPLPLAAPGQMPPMQPGDGKIESVSFNVAKDTAGGDAALPELQPGQVVWMRPVLVGASERYLSARPLPAYPYPPLAHADANLHMKVNKAGERTLKIKDLAQITVQQGKMKMTEGLRFEADVLEVLTPEPSGKTGARLTIGKNRFNDEFNGKQIAMEPDLSQRLGTLSPNFLQDATGKLRERGNPAFPQLAKPQRDKLEMMYNRVCNAFELTSVYMPNRAVKPRETWPARIPTVTGNAANKRIVDLDLTCTYEGSRTNNGRSEAVITLLGPVKSRDKAKQTEPLGLVRGRVVFDIEAGMVTEVEVHVATELDSHTTAQMLVTEDVTVTRVGGNTANIVAANRNPAPPAPKAPEPKAPVIVKNVLEKDDTLGNLDLLFPINGRKHKHYDVKLQADVTYIIEMKQGMKTNMNPFLFLLDSAGKEVLAKDDDSGGNKNAKITFKAPHDGVYRVIATTAGSQAFQTGRFHISVMAKD
jgi:predicted Zn finger-like uncharacterized protein